MRVAKHVCKAGGTISDQQCVISAKHDFVGDGSGVTDAAESGDSASAVSAAIHHRGIEFDNTVFVGKPTKANGHFFGVIFDDLHTLNHGTQEWLP